MKKVIGTLLLVIIGGASWYLLSPLFISKTVDEDLPEKFSDFYIPTEEEFLSMSEEDQDKLEIQTIEAFADKGTTVDELMRGTSVNLISAGQFVDADSFHMGSGTAKILESNKDVLLRFENFKVTNGPDLRVLLVKSVDLLNKGDLGEYIDLGKLKGNEGNQNYTIPENIDASQYAGVVIYCKPFHVIFSVSELK